MAEKDKRYYWLKLKRDFFKRHDIKIVESLPNGKEYILFYLKLLCESVDHDGSLRFSDKIPYSEEMLATITNTNVDIVRSAVKLFSQLDMIEVLDDGTYFMNQVEDMIGSETYWAEKKREQRQKGNTLFPPIPVDAPPVLDNVQQESNDSPTCPSKSKSKSKNKNKNNISSSDLADEFERLWSIYPAGRKQGKKKALEYYQKARRSGTTFEAVKDGIESYLRYIKAERIETRFIKQASTFFSQQAWQDEWTTSKAQITDDELDGIL